MGSFGFIVAFLVEVLLEGCGEFGIDMRICRVDGGVPYATGCGLAAKRLVP